MYAKLFTFRGVTCLVTYPARLKESTKETLALRLAQALGEPLDPVRALINDRLIWAPDRDPILEVDKGAGTYSYRAQGHMLCNHPLKDLIHVNQE